jgi:signal transduction histidine kinase
MTTPDAALPTALRLAPAVLDVLVGAVVAALARWTGPTSSGDGLILTVAVTAGVAVAAGISRPRPAVGLLLVWLVALAQVAGGRVLVGGQLAVPVVAFRVARHGARATVWTAALSIPAGTLSAVALAFARPQVFRDLPAVGQLLQVWRVGIVATFVTIGLAVAAPFAIGLVLRVNERYERSRAEHERARAQAEREHAIAEARAAQTRLTREVHDVVGHSLAVIIAQADAARLAAHDDAVRTALTRIAEVGRTSLAEVREVLSRTRDAAEADRTVASTERLPELDELIDGVRAAGNELSDTESGHPVALPDPVAGTAYRVLQELLTNALKHATAHNRIEVARVWTADGLTIRVANTCPDPPAGTDAAIIEGMGIAGIRSRLGAVGGTLRLARTRGTFVATAFVPAAYVPAARQ